MLEPIYYETDYKKDVSASRRHVHRPIIALYTGTVGWLVVFRLTSHRQRGHLETAPPFTVP